MSAGIAFHCLPGISKHSEITLHPSPCDCGSDLRIDSERNLWTVLTNFLLPRLLQSCYKDGVALRLDD
jgi:hypothetical protein